MNYIDHSSFHDPTARDAIVGPLTDPADDQVSRRFRSSEWLTPLPAARCGPPFLSREQEAHLFRKMNYLKYRATQLREQLDPDWPNPADLDEIERLQCEALAVKNRIVEMYLLLVVSIAKARVRARYDLSECVSDGNLRLIEAVDGFDFARGYRFSTYATWAIRNALVDNERRFIRRGGYHFALNEEPVAAPDSGVDEREREREEARNHRQLVVERWLGRLDERERRILVSRYGIGGAPKQTLVQIGQELGISKERVRQIEARANAKLRKIAQREAPDLRSR
ncbi:MAG TPA: sigma-70 family RNA polymerase sigma factor [Isosphaeraceae bacterium]|nr:sigma-70 family RNA polymerase sigma factor [Isosphaeraceae bacterium]